MAVPTPLSFWPLQTNSNDFIGSTNGTDTSVTYSSGANLVRTNSSRISWGASPFTGTGDFSVAGWVNLTDQNIQQYMIANYTSAVDGIWAFHVDNTNSKLNFWDYNGSAFNFLTTAYSTGTISTGTLTHVGFTRVGTTGTYYINGSASGTTTASSVRSYVNTQTLATGTVSNPYYWNGQLQYWGIWNVALSASDMATLYNSGTPFNPFASTSDSMLTFF